LVLQSFGGGWLRFGLPDLIFGAVLLPALFFVLGCGVSSVDAVRLTAPVLASAQECALWVTPPGAVLRLVSL
jgi:hypothetical protein